MKKVLQFIALIMIGFILKTNAQDKHPIALPDHYGAVSGFQYTFNPLLNDIIDEGHTARILLVYASPNSDISFNDSCIFYTAAMSFQGLDSIRYRIKDNQNGLISEIANIYINVVNESMDTININNISALINPYGCLFWDYFESNHYEFPKGSGLSTIFSLGLNIAATDEYQNQYLSGILQRQFGADFFPGPVSFEEHYNFLYDSTWTRVWKLNKEEILMHISSWDQEGYEVPRNIAGWPGNGDPSKGQTSMMAPFHDRNDNGIYDPLNGDYPIIRGDQAVYFIYNDSRAPHTEFGGTGLMTEIHCMVYAFDLPENPALNNTVFINYLVTNRSNISYKNMNLALFADTDIGVATDDFVSCDTLLNAAISYNGQVPDSGIGGVEYGDHPPAQSIMLLNREMSSFIVSSAYNPTHWQWISRPEGADELINNLNALWKDGSPIIGSGCGHHSCASGNAVKYVFPGNPNDEGSWSMLQSPIGMNDYAYFVNIQPVMDFNPGETICIDVALTSAMDENGDHLDSYTLVKQYAETVKAFYDANFPASCFDVSPGIDEVKNPDNKNQLIIYPNPADEIIGLNSNLPIISAEYRIFDVTGRMKLSGKLGIQNQTIDVKILEPGLYFVQVHSYDKAITSKLIKK